MPKSCNAGHGTAIHQRDDALRLAVPVIVDALKSRLVLMLGRRYTPTTEVLSSCPEIEPLRAIIAILGPDALPEDTPDWLLAEVVRQEIRPMPKSRGINPPNYDDYTGLNGPPPSVENEPVVALAMNEEVVERMIRIFIDSGITAGEPLPSKYDELSKSAKEELGHVIRKMLVVIDDRNV
jgi:hypothetical protein